MNEIMISRDGASYGPYSVDKAKEYVAAGSLLADDQAVVVVQSDWKSLGALLADLERLGATATPAENSSQAVDEALKKSKEAAVLAGTLVSEAGKKFADKAGETAGKVFELVADKGGKKGKKVAEILKGREKMVGVAAVLVAVVIALYFMLGSSGPSQKDMDEAQLAEARANAEAVFGARAQEEQVKRFYNKVTKINKCKKDGEVYFCDVLILDQAVTGKYMKSERGWRSVGFAPK